MKQKKIPLSFCFFVLLFLLSHSAFALRVKQIHPETGVLTLDDARQVQLAGVKLAPEAFKSMAVLFSSQDIDLDEEKSLSAAAGVPVVYISMKAMEIPFPNKDNAQPRGAKISLNEMLVSSGLASVDDTKDFKKKDDYLKLQEEAKRLGKGIWSQEPPSKTKS